MITANPRVRRASTAAVGVLPREPGRGRAWTPSAWHDVGADFVPAKRFADGPAEWPGVLEVQRLVSTVDDPAWD